MTTFLLIRHGLTDAVARYFAGRAAGTPLNATGREDAARAAERLRHVRLSAVVSSPLERTRETAALIAAPHGLPVDVEPAFNEFEVGSWTGATFEDLAADRDWSRFNALRSFNRAPGGELMVEVQQRAVSALVDLASRHDGGIVAVVSHGDVIRALVMYCLGIPLDLLHRLAIDPARITIVEVSRDGLRVRQVNGDTATLLA